MAKYIVEMQMDKQEKFYFIRENESGDIVYLPSKYLMHKKRSKMPMCGIWNAFTCQKIGLTQAIQYSD